MPPPKNFVIGKGRHILHWGRTGSSLCIHICEASSQVHIVCTYTCLCVHVLNLALFWLFAIKQGLNGHWVFLNWAICHKHSNPGNPIIPCPGHCFSSTKNVVGASLGATGFLPHGTSNGASCSSSVWPLYRCSNESMELNGAVSMLPLNHTSGKVSKSVTPQIMSDSEYCILKSLAAQKKKLVFQ